MNRTIKFRAWDVFYKKFLYGDYSTIANNMDEFWTIVKGGENSGREVPLMQFTGLLDKNGKEIYEGDVVKDAWGAVKEVKIEEIFHASYEDTFAGYGFGFDTHGIEDFKEKVEVIGNIYENPELLKK